MGWHAFLILGIGCTGLLVGCGSERPLPSDSTYAFKIERPESTPDGGMRSIALSEASVSSTSLFEAMPGDASGLSFLAQLDEKHDLRFLYHSGLGCGGVAIGDVNDDGRPDLFFAAGPGRNKLFLQVDDWRFEDVSKQAGVAGGGEWSTGVSMVDIDNDHDLDIYVCNYESPNRLFLNRGDGSFEEGAEAAGLALVDACLMPTFCDYDRDGDLDCYVVTYRYYNPAGAPGDAIFERQGDQHAIKHKYQKYSRVIHGSERTRSK